MEKIKEIIESKANAILYSSSFTSQHKFLVYKAFSNLFDHFPKEMENYLVNNSRSGGFQHKVFQEYIRLLENSFPFIIRKNKKQSIIRNLLDPNLCIFDGISVFEGIVDEKNCIKNNTREFYIGGRKSTYAKPFYIGKILNLVNKETKEQIKNSVVEYSFSKIKISKNIKPGTEVIVTHLRIPPHYQMGGMVYVNRMRKEIINEINAVKNE